MRQRQGKRMGTDKVGCATCSRVTNCSGLFKKMNCGGKKEINIKEKQIRERKSKKK
jgi:hypothetical protein